ncbi:hypothetical protein Vadar_002758 [Vaccinium darrowii]|uniref:Uncharacterized protein n=1 Tax=Vaccinium darrowii TaxID=229202 RepID=A0ACB7WXE3_9ERIC|nr:hypothetical protein Vadar_002758 [Vaccinium darrowii]
MMKVSPLPSSVVVGFEVLLAVLNWNEKVVEKEVGVFVMGLNRRIGEGWILQPTRWWRLVVWGYLEGFGCKLLVGENGIA